MARPLARPYTLLAAVVLVAGIAPAAASGTVECEAGQGGAALRLTVGSLPVLSVAHMEVTAGGRTWTTGDAEGDGIAAITIGQAFADGERWLIDATDPNVEHVIVEIRLTGASEAGDTALAGTVKVAGVGAFAVSCIGP